MDYAKTLEEFFDRPSNWKMEIAMLRELMLSTGLEEKLKWGFPCYCWNNKNIVSISDFKSYFGIWFFQGGLLKDKSAVLKNAQEGKTKAMRQWRFYNRNEIDKKLILAYVSEALENQKAGRVIKASQPNTTISKMPDILLEAFKNDGNLDKCFNLLTPGKRKEYVNYILEAKRESTKISRISKIIPLIKAGGGLNDKYKK